MTVKQFIKKFPEGKEVCERVYRNTRRKEFIKDWQIRSVSYTKDEFAFVLKPDDGSEFVTVVWNRQAKRCTPATLTIYEE